MSGQSIDSQFAALTRDIDWQRASFLANNLDIVLPLNQDQTVLSPSENIVRKILDHYFLIALLFYRQLRADLAEQFRAGKLSERDVKTLLQNGLDKLVTEWYRVYAVVLSIRANEATGKASEIIQEMLPIMQAAQKDAYLATDFLSILHFGQNYSMRFFNYLEGLAALNTPLATFESPWEWTILWHELAGEKIRELKNKNAYFFDDMFYNLMTQLDEEQIAALQDRGWSVDWLEELFEDSFSVANFPIHFLYVFKNLLERFADIGGKDTRHPPQAIRLATAISFQLQRKGISQQPNLQDEAESRKIWAELAGASEHRPDWFSEFDPAQLLSNNSLDLKIAQLASQKFLNWHAEQQISDTTDRPIHDLISRAIVDYSHRDERNAIIERTFLALKQAAEGLSGNIGRHIPNDTLPQIEEVVRSKRLTNHVENNQILDALEADHPKVWRLLRNQDETEATKLGYEDLMSLAFDDVDYGVETVTNVKYNNNPQFGDGIGKLKSIITLAPSGKVSFTLSTNKTKQANVDAWNNAAATGYTITK